MMKQKESNEKRRQQTNKFDQWKLFVFEYDFLKISVKIKREIGKAVLVTGHEGP